MMGIASAPEPQILPPNSGEVSPPQEPQAVPAGVQETAPPPQSTPMQPPRKKRSWLLWVLLAGVLLLIFLGSMMVGNTATEVPNTVRSTPTSMTTPIPAVTLTLSPFATESAFLEFETQLDTVTRGIQNAPIDNQAILPPRLELPLGFTR